MLPGPFSREERNVKKFDVFPLAKTLEDVVFSRDQAFTNEAAKCRDLAVCWLSVGCLLGFGVGYAKRALKGLKKAARKG
jgi:hypothetical protein